MTVTFFLYSIRPPPPSTPFPTRRSSDLIASDSVSAISQSGGSWTQTVIPVGKGPEGIDLSPDRKSTRLNSSHVSISYAVFCLKKKKRSAQGESQSCLHRRGQSQRCLTHQ